MGVIQMQVAVNFRILCNNLTVDKTTRSKIAVRYKMINRRLNLDFWSTSAPHSLYVGSYGRGTAVRGFSDLDIIFILPPHLEAQYNAYKYNGQSALLKAVKHSLQKTYPTTYIGGDGQVVVIQFTDNIKFEVVPVFFKKDGSFSYPDSNNGGSWKITNPRPEIKMIKSHNKLTKDKLIDLCRMARSWRKKWNIPMGGLLIDTLANDFIMNWKYKYFPKTKLLRFDYYDLMSRDFFQFLCNQNTERKFWFAVGSNQKVWRKGRFEYKAQKCYNLALQAIELQSKNMNYSANQKWREIYGTAYPN
jgi:hypothetical protein